MKKNNVAKGINKRRPVGYELFSQHRTKSATRHETIGLNKAN